MPELPEVQCFVDDLNKSYAGAILNGIVLRRRNLRSLFNVRAMRQVFAAGSCLLSCERVGKRLVLRTDRGAFLISLGMSGAFQPGVKHKPALHEHISLEFADGRVLAFVDPRRFGDWLPFDGSWGNGVVDGLDARGLKRLFMSDTIRTACRPVKVMLLDQSLIGGVGNIYALEALFDAGIHPMTLCSSVPLSAWEKLARCLPRIFRAAIAAGGSSISSYERHGHTQGGFQKCHRVYGREGLPCARRGCQGIVLRLEQAGRSSWFCPCCQPEISALVRKPNTRP